MIFDDHDLVDDWNTSAAWLADMRATPWWQERVLSGLMSYWVYQHLGNLTPAELATDELYAAVRAQPDGTDLLRRFASEADRDPACTRWSYRRDFGRTRLLMVDSRAARVLDEQHRAMLDEDEARWVRDQVLDGRGPAPDGRDSAEGPYDHLLIGTSLPWLLPPFIHDLESWNSALCHGERGPRWARFGERLRRAADLEHWAAFPDSFEELAALIAEAGSGPGAPATVCVLSGDVHHAYVAEPSWPAGDPDAPGPPVDLLPGAQLRPRLYETRLPFRLEPTGPAPGACPDPARPGRPVLGRLGQDGRAVVRESADDADDAGPFGRPPAGPCPRQGRRRGAGDRTGASSDDLRTGKGPGARRPEDPAP